MNIILSVDLGVKTGLACWTTEGRLLWYRSQNYGSKERLHRAIRAILDQFDTPATLVLEGGGRLAEIWETSSKQAQWQTKTIHAEEWRRMLIVASEWAYCHDLKKLSIDYAIKACQWGGHPVAGTLNHNAAEAILVGLWFLLKSGSIDKPPWPLPTNYRSK